MGQSLIVSDWRLLSHLRALRACFYFQFNNFSNLKIDTGHWTAFEILSMSQVYFPQIPGYPGYRLNTVGHGCNFGGGENKFEKDIWEWRWMQQIQSTNLRSICIWVTIELKYSQLYEMSHFFKYAGQLTTCGGVGGSWNSLNSLRKYQSVFWIFLFERLELRYVLKLILLSK